MRWPSSRDYNEAVQDPSYSFQDDDLRMAAAVTNTLGLPAPRSGNFADVYQLRSVAGRSWAVKCFTREVSELRRRYQAISEHLSGARAGGNLPFMVEFQYLDEGIQIDSDRYPVVKMTWVEGKLLHEFVRDHLDDSTLLTKLAGIWHKLAQNLRAAGMAHGDLQHGNVLLVPTTRGGVIPRLIDYDGMYVPALANTPASEVGHPNYQHPGRDADRFHPEIDRFPLLLVYAAIRCLAVGGRRLWERYDSGDNLLFKEADIKTPGGSALCRELWGLTDPSARALAGWVILAGRMPQRKVPLLDELLGSDGKRVPSLTLAQQAEVQQLLSPRSTTLPYEIVEQEAEEQSSLTPTPRRTTPPPLPHPAPRTPAMADQTGMESEEVEKLLRQLRYYLGLSNREVSLAVEKKFLRQLSDQEREIVRLYYLEGRTFAEIRTETGLSVSTIGVILSRARAKLREAASSTEIPALHDTPARQAKQPKATTADIPSLERAKPIAPPRTPARPTGSRAVEAVTSAAAKTRLSKAPAGDPELSRPQKGMLFVGIVLGVFGIVLGLVVVFASRNPSTPQQQAVNTAVPPAPAGVVQLSVGDVTLKAGEKKTVPVQVTNRYTGDFTLEVTGLPDKVTAKPVYVPGYPPLISIEFAAAPNATPGKMTVTIRPMNNGVPIQHSLDIGVTVLASEILGTHAGTVYGVAISGDGKRVVAVGAGKQVRVWDLDSKKELAGFPVGFGLLNRVALSADGKRALTSSGRLLEVWDVDQGKAIHKLTQTQHVSASALSVDGKRAVGGGSDGDLQVWDAETGKELHQLPGHTGRVYGVAISRDGKRAISVGTDKTIRVWEMAKGTELRQLPGTKVTMKVVAISPDGKRAVTGSFDGKLYVWDVEHGKQPDRTMPAHVGYVTGIAISDDGKLAVSSGLDKIVRVWDLDTGKELHQFTGHTDSVQGVAISKDGKRVVSGGSDKTVRVWVLPEAGSAPVVPPMNPGPADAKIDPKKLIGKWEPADSAPLVVEFAENGKLIMSIGIGGKSEKVEGTYKLDGDKLELIVSLGGKEEKETGTITKLTDDELILKSTRSGEELKLKKAKPKK